MRFKKIVKYAIVTLFAGISILFALFAIIPVVESLTIYKSDDLELLQSELIPPNFDINEILTTDVLFPAWNLDEQEPILFSKVSKE